MSLPTLAEAQAAVAKHGGSMRRAADSLGISYWQLRRVLQGLLAKRTRDQLGYPEDSLSTAAKLRALERDNARLKARVNELLDRKNAAQTWEEFVASVATAKLPAPEWTVAPQAGRKSAIVLTALSDIHYGEEVRPEEVEWSNKFDAVIAERRIRAYFENVVQLARGYVAGVEIEGLCLALLGDMISGEIHEELAETNDLTLAEAVLGISSLVAEGIRRLAEEFGRIEVVGVPGNHGRTTKKPRAKKRATKNLDWLVYHLLRRECEGIEGASFLIPEGADAAFRLYSTRFLATHGDQFRGGSGIAGALSPLLLGDHRKRKRALAMGAPFDVLLFGHWHKLLLGFSGMLGNGSVKGYDEYAYTSNLDYEPPQQAFALVDPRHGLTLRAPVHLDDGEAQEEAA